MKAFGMPRRDAHLDSQEGSRPITAIIRKRLDPSQACGGVV